MQAQLLEGMQSICGPGTGPLRDIDLGRRSDLLARSVNCPTCRTILSFADQDAVAVAAEDTSGTAADEMFSAHLMDTNPILGIAFGPSPTAIASERRSLLDQILTVWLSSTNGRLSVHSERWLTGTPRLYKPEQVDPGQIMEWLDCCQRTHGKQCRPDSAAFAIRAKVSSSFIDVESECIVKPDHDVVYVALSYVWGAVETLQATKANIKTLSRPRSLSTSSNHAVPATIRDAMKLCALVGRRYLWVDRVCIVQDDFESKLQHLEAMADTYAKADFTIVAADGTHADHGLSGLGRRTEERRKHLVSLPSRTLIREAKRRTGQEELADTVWSARAWTFQEHIFARRLLFMGEHMRWFCYSATWYEERSLPPVFSEGEAEGVDLHGQGVKLFATSWPSLTTYADMVEQYNLRQLTYDSDVFNAFSGIMAQLCYGFPAGFYGGMTEFYFTICLLWQPGSGLRPRSVESSCAPSWSWLGWAGQLDLEMWRCNTDAQLPHNRIETAISPLVKFFKKADRANHTSSRIDDTFHIVRTHFTINDAPAPDRWQKHDGDAVSNFAPFYTYLGYYGPSHIDTNRRFRYPVPAFQRPRDINPIDSKEHKLYFSTQRAYLVLGTPNEDSQWRFSEHQDGRFYAVEVPIFTAPGAWAGSVRVNARDTERVPTGEKLEFIRIARGSVPIKSTNTSPNDAALSDTAAGDECRHPFEECVRREELQAEVQYDFYFVLWIERDGANARRKALGTVWERVWDRAEPEDIEIVLV